MSNQVSRFAAAQTGQAKDKSSGKTIVTGDSGIGKTYFISSIEAEDGRPIFLIPIEEGLKGVSPLHRPASFTDANGNPLVPSTFGELVEALTVFRDQRNVPAPPENWADSLPYPIGSLERRVLGELTSAFPQWLTASVLCQRTGAAPDAMHAALMVLGTDRRISRDQGGSLRALPNNTWKRPFLHLGIDSLSGVEKLIHAETTGRANLKSMADKEYNRLWIEAQPLWQQIQDLLDSIRKATGCHIWIVAHCIEDIEASQTSGEIYRARDLMLKGSGKTLVEIRQFWRQWADSVWYIMRDVAVQKGDKTRRTMASHRGRFLITSETAQCKAKSRLAIPPRLPATWPDVKAALMALQPAPAERIAERIAALLSSLPAEHAAQIQGDVAKALEAGAHRVAQLSAILSRTEGLIACADEDGRGEEPPPSGEGEKGEEAPAHAPPMPPVGFDDTPPENGM